MLDGRDLKAIAELIDARAEKTEKKLGLEMSQLGSRMDQLESIRSSS